MSRFGPGTMMALIFAILIGLGGAYVVREYLNRPVEKVEPLPTTPPKQIVFTATRELKPGRTITLTDMGVNRFTAEEYRAFQAKYPGKILLGDNKFVLGRMLKTGLVKGEPFTTESFYPDGTGPGVEHDLSPGMVARTLPITAGQGILKFVSPGSIVDVLFRARPPAPSQTFTMLRGVKVLAIGGVVNENQQRNDQSSDRSRTPPSVTVEVSRYQAEWISVVRDRGDLEVVLRNRKYLPSDTDTSSRLSMSQLVRLPVGVRAKGMSVYLGSKRETMIFDRRVTYNDDLLIPTPIPRFPPASVPPKAAGKDNVKKEPAKK